MDPEKERFEVESGGADDHDLAINHASVREDRRERLDELREITVHRLLIATLQQDLATIAKNDRSEAIPLRLELPPVANRQSISGRGQHRSEGRIEGQAHR